MKKAFTLIELLMVIAIIAIISTLAVNKLGGVKESAARKVSLANQKAIERGVESFLSFEGNRLNRLDALLEAKTSGTERGNSDGFGSTIITNLASGGFYTGPTDATDATAATIAEHNKGLPKILIPVLCYYSLNQSEVNGLIHRLGLKHLMFHNTYANPSDDPAKTPYQIYGHGDDGSVPTETNGMNPESAACIVRGVTNGMYVAAINPKTNRGRAIYRACGQDLIARYETDAEYSDQEAKDDVALTGGPLIAFGLGDHATIIGDAKAGLDSAPSAAFTSNRHYRRYILLFRLKNVSGVLSSIPEFAGVLDCEGNTISSAKAVIQGL